VLARLGNALLLRSVSAVSRFGSRVMLLTSFPNEFRDFEIVVTPDLGRDTNVLGRSVDQLDAEDERRHEPC